MANNRSQDVKGKLANDVREQGQEETDMIRHYRCVNVVIRWMRCFSKQFEDRPPVAEAVLLLWERRAPV